MMIISDWWFQTLFIFHFIYGMSSFPLTFIFFKMVKTTHSIYSMMGTSMYPMTLQLQLQADSQRVIAASRQRCPRVTWPWDENNSCN